MEQKLTLILWAYSYLVKADNKVELLEIVKLKEFIAQELEEEEEVDFEKELKEFLSFEDEDFDEFFKENLKEFVDTKVSLSFKRRLIYSLSRIMKSKSEHIDEDDYQKLLEIGEKLGFSNIRTNSIIEEVFNIKETIFIIAGVSVIIGALYFFKDLFVPLVFAYFLSRIIKTLSVKFYELFRRKIKISYTTIFSFLIIFSLLVGVYFVGEAAVNSFVSDFEKIKSAAVERVNNSPKVVKDFLSPLLSGKFDEGMVKGSLKSINKLISEFSSVFVYILLIIVYTIFMSFPGKGYLPVLSDIDKKVSSYISVKFFLSILTGFLFFFVISLFHVSLAVFWGFQAFLLNFIPNIGSILATIAPAIFCLLFYGFKKTVVILLILAVIQFVIGNIVEPLLLGVSMKIKPITVLWGLVFWGILWGISGMFLSAPLMVVVKNIAENYNFSNKFSKML